MEHYSITAIYISHLMRKSWMDGPPRELMTDSCRKILIFLLLSDFLDKIYYHSCKHETYGILHRSDALLSQVLTHQGLDKMAAIS